MSPTRPVLRTPLGLAAVGLIVAGVLLGALLGGGPEWFSVDGGVVYRTDPDELGLSADDGSLTPLADVFVQIYPALMFFTAVAVALAGWAQRVLARIAVAVPLLALATGFVIRTRDEAATGAVRSAADAGIVLGAGPVVAAALVGLVTMMLGVSQSVRSLAGALLVLVLAVGQAVGLAQMLAAATVDVSPTAVPLASVGSLLLIAASLAVLAVAAARSPRARGGEA